MDNSIKKSTTRYSSTEKQQLVERWKQSGLSRQAFCLQNKLSYHALHYWTRTDRQRKDAEGSVFIPIKVQPSEATIFARVELGNGRIVDIFQSVAATYLKRLLD